MSQIKQVFPKSQGMPDDWVAVRIDAKLLEGGGRASRDSGPVADWLKAHNISLLDVYYSDAGYGSSYGEVLTMDLWFEPQHRQAAMLFKLTWGGQ